MIESQEDPGGDESLADTDAEVAEISKGLTNGEEEPLSDDEPLPVEIQEGDEND